MPKALKDTSAFRVTILIQTTSMRFPPEDPDDYTSDMDDDHDLVADIDSDTLIKLIKFLRRGKAPGPDNIHNEVLRLGTTTSLLHHLARLFTSSIQIGYIPTAWKLGRGRAEKKRILMLTLKQADVRLEYKARVRFALPYSWPNINWIVA